MLLMCYASALSYDLVLLIAWYSLIYFYDELINDSTGSQFKNVPLGESYEY